MKKNGFLMSRLKYLKLKLKEIETSTKESKSIPTTQQHWYQNFYGSPSPPNGKPGTSHVGLDNNGAVTRIQAGYHGHKARKESKVSLLSSQDKREIEKEKIQVIREHV